MRGPLDGRDSLEQGLSWPLLITQVPRETQYGNNMFFVRILIEATSKKLVLEVVSGNTFSLNAKGVLQSRGLF